MGVEAHTRRSDGTGEQQLSARRENALQLSGCLATAQGIQRIPVAAEADVLDHVQAGHGLQ